MRPDKKKGHQQHSSQQEKKDEKLKQGQTSQENSGDKEDDPEEPKQSSKYANRKLESNWQKYSIPTSDDEDNKLDDNPNFMTGEDFSQAVQRAGGSDSLFRTKAEKEWESSNEEEPNEFFSLNLANLERKIAGIPVYDQIDIDKQHLDDRCQLLLNKYAEMNSATTNSNEVNEAILEKLKKI